jgi:hypothetical protein
MVNLRLVHSAPKVSRSLQPWEQWLLGWLKSYQHGETFDFKRLSECSETEKVETQVCRSSRQSCVVIEIVAGKSKDKAVPTVLVPPSAQPALGRSLAVDSGWSDRSHYPLAKGAAPNTVQRDPLDSPF